VTWIEAGQPYELFWDLTLREVTMILEGINRGIRRARDENMVLAWHIEALARQKKLPKLSDMLKAEKKPTGRRQTPEQIEATVRGWLGSRYRK
jgi:hypothetical protein